MAEVEASIDQQHEPPEKEKSRVLSDLVVGILLVAVLGLAAYLRFTGLNWDSHTHLHPDERFLTMVETSIQPPQSIGEYFNTETSTLNPHNVGHGFFVYGSFPIFLVRYLAEWTGMSGYDEVHLLGRAVSGISDLVSILLIYLIGERLFNRRVGILAALFTALSVLLIQHAHFFVVDPLANVFILAGLYFSVRVIGQGRLSDYLLFGVMLGLAVASKISAAPLAVVVALAGLTNILCAPSDQRSAVFSRTLTFLLGAALLSLLVFRIFQPYAFEGPGFLDVKFNPKWLANMAEVRGQQAGNTDAPYALQWADRAPVFFSLKNMILWGLGIPLGILGWVGLGWAVVEMIRGRWKRYLIPVVWTAGTFIWQSINFTKAMRYQLPVYPTMALFAAWALWHAWESIPQLNAQWRKAARVGVLLVGSITILGTALWAFAFHSIYSEPLTRVSASRWIYRNIPAVVNLVGEADGETFLETIPVPIPFDLISGDTYTTEISTDASGVIRSVLLPYVSTGDGQGGILGISVTLADEPNAGVVNARGEYRGDVLEGEEARVEIQLDRPFNINP
ncbi:MAG: glycosyltransferase family 39 protein, partial [Anaerolineales bacterium]|nr:glycosyltransferase family 39 protein [Anaerolineales bacterium]